MFTVGLVTKSCHTSNALNTLRWVLFILQTRILVTHGVHWLPQVDTILVLSNGQISEIGTYEELMTHNGAFAQFLTTYLTQHNNEDSDVDEEEEEDGKCSDLLPEINLYKTESES